MAKNNNKNNNKNESWRDPNLSKYTTISQLNQYVTNKYAEMATAQAAGNKNKVKTLKKQIAAAEKSANTIDQKASSKYLNGKKGSFDILGKWKDKGSTVNNYLATRAKTQGYDSNLTSGFSKMVTNSLTGIEGIPYQFSGSVDRRMGQKSNGKSYTPAENTGVGRKYGEKILSRFPFLFITPCTVDFMRGFNAEDKQTITSALLSGGDIPANFSELLQKSGRFYTVDFAYKEYYQYFNCMMNALAIYLGIGNVKMKIGNKTQTLRSANWSAEANKDFTTYFSAKENLIFYVDGFSSVSQSFSNDTGDSSLASALNSFSDQVNEIKFLFGSSGGAAKEILKVGSDATASITNSLSGLLGKLGGGIVESLANNGVNTILNGGKIIFPEVWSNSSMDDGSASFDFKFRSPDNDTLSIYLNVLKPYCKLLCLVMPHQSRDKNDNYDQNSYTSPFLVKSALKGKFAVDTGMITSMSVTKGAECQWNDDGLPTQIDISIDIKNLYKNMALSSYAQPSWTIVNNTAYMDFIANMAGLNILQMDMLRKEKYFVYLTANKIANIPSNLGVTGSQAISRLMGRLYNLTS